MSVSILVVDDEPDVAELFRIAPDQARARCHRVKKKFGSILRAQELSRDPSGPS